MFNNRPKHQQPTFGYSLFVTMGLAVIILGSYKLLSAPINFMFLVAWLFIFPCCMYLGYTYSEINEAVLDQIRKGMTGILIMLSVGSVIAAWIACGCIPAIIYYGLGIVEPKFSLLETFLLCLIVSTATGTSWGTAASAGVAMLGIGMSLGIPNAVTVGAIVSGAMFGDSICPLSDGANITAISVNVNVFKHCKEISLIAFPSAFVSAILFVMIGSG